MNIKELKNELEQQQNKTQSNKQRAREWDRRKPAPAPALFGLFIGKTTPNAKWG